MPIVIADNPLFSVVHGSGPVPRELRRAQARPDLVRPAVARAPRAMASRSTSASRRRYVLLIIVLTAVTLITLDTRNGRSGPLGALGRAAHTIVVADRGRRRRRRRARSATGGTASSTPATSSRRTATLRQRARGGGRQAARARSRRSTRTRSCGSCSSSDGLLDVDRVERADHRPRHPATSTRRSRSTTAATTASSEDMPVIAPDGVVGHVIEVWRDGAKVRLLTDPDVRGRRVRAGACRAGAATGIAEGRVGSDELIVADFDAGADVRRPAIRS